MKKRKEQKAAEEELDSSPRSTDVNYSGEVITGVDVLNTQLSMFNAQFSGSFQFGDSLEN
jgi:outer membrane protein TolC